MQFICISLYNIWQYLTIFDLFYSSSEAGEQRNSVEVVAVVKWHPHLGIGWTDRAHLEGSHHNSVRIVQTASSGSWFDIKLLLNKTELSRCQGWWCAFCSMQGDRNSAELERGREETSLQWVIWDCWVAHHPMCLVCHIKKKKIKWYPGLKRHSPKATG